MDRRFTLQDLLNESKRLETVIKEAETRLNDAPEGNVRVVKHHKGHQFYYRTYGNDKSGAYMPVSEKKTAIALIQKGYDRKILRAAKKQAAVINRFLKDYDRNILGKIYSSFSESKRKYIEPFDITDSDYARRWQEQKYNSKSFQTEMPEHYSDKGVRVRSKTEVMIANQLDRANVPYRYECQLILGNHVLYPDFTILRTKDRKIIYWEHLGLMDESDYRNNTLQRIRLYETYGIFPGENLILTMETSKQPINTKVINQFIAHYCL